MNSNSNLSKNHYHHPDPPENMPPPPIQMQDGFIYNSDGDDIPVP